MPMIDALVMVLLVIVPSWFTDVPPFQAGDADDVDEIFVAEAG